MPCERRTLIAYMDRARALITSSTCSATDSFSVTVTPSTFTRDSLKWRRWLYETSLLWTRSLLTWIGSVSGYWPATTPRYCWSLAGDYWYCRQGSPGICRLHTSAWCSPASRLAGQLRWRRTWPAWPQIPELCWHSRLANVTCGRWTTCSDCVHWKKITYSKQSCLRLSLSLSVALLQVWLLDYFVICRLSTLSTI